MVLEDRVHPPISSQMLLNTTMCWLIHERGEILCVCPETQVGILQYGETAVHEWSLKDYQTTQEVVEAAKNISRQEGRETRTAYAIDIAW